MNATKEIKIPQRGSIQWWVALALAHRTKEGKMFNFPLNIKKEEKLSFNRSQIRVALGHLYRKGLAKRLSLGNYLANDILMAWYLERQRKEKQKKEIKGELLEAKTDPEILELRKDVKTLMNKIEILSIQMKHLSEEMDAVRILKSVKSVLFEEGF